MPFIIISLLIQAAFVIHIVKTGRDTTWIWIVVMLPVAGLLAYLVLEVLPELSNTRAGRQAQRRFSEKVNPNRDLNSAFNEFSRSGTVANSLRLANECLAKEHFSEARELFERCLEGIHKNDPDIMVGLAKAHFGLKEYSDAKDMLDLVKELNPDYRNADAHLLYARSLERMGLGEEALHEYEALHSYFLGPEASVYYARCLKALGQRDKAQIILDQVLQQAERAGKSYQRLHQEYLKMAKNELTTG